MSGLFPYVLGKLYNSCRLFLQILTLYPQILKGFHTLIFRGKLFILYFRFFWVFVSLLFVKFALFLFGFQCLFSKLNLRYFLFLFFMEFLFLSFWIVNLLMLMDLRRDMQNLFHSFFLRLKFMRLLPLFIHFLLFF